jgi:hypothetical protein
MVSLSFKVILMIIDKKSEIVSRKVKAYLEASEPGMPNVFENTTRRIEDAKQERDQALDAHKNSRRKHILVAFRKAVKAFEQTFPEKVTHALLNMRDVEDLASAYNVEANEEKAHEPVSNYDFDNDGRLMDGILVRKGCDNKPGEMDLSSKA